MAVDDVPPVALDRGELRRLREALREHGVGLALLFGSAADPDGDVADFDVAVEFTEAKPSDDGYATAYLDCYSALEDELDGDVDLVDVHSTSPAFAAAVVFEDGVLVLGSPDRRVTLERRLAGETPSVEGARERVTAAADRLGEWSA